MQTQFGQTNETIPVQAAYQTISKNGSKPTGKEIPFDYVATFILEGKRGNCIHDVISVSMEGAFVAVSVGYSFIPAPLRLALNPQGNPAQPVAERIGSMSTFLNAAMDPRLLIESLFQSLLVRLCGIEFKYSIVDSATGRELQNKPIHNIAGLGEANGIRPFRPMAKPMLFQPCSTIRIQIEEVSDSPLYARAELYLVLHGYKLLGYGT